MPRTDIGTDEGKHSRHYDKDQDYTINRKERSAKHRYVYFTGSKTKRKHWTRALRYEVQPYQRETMVGTRHAPYIHRHNFFEWNEISRAYGYLPRCGWTET